MSAPRTLLLVCVAALAAGASPTPSAAESAETMEETPEVVYVYGTRMTYRERESNSGTRTPTPIEDIPQAVFVITRDVIDDQAMTGLGDLVRYVPGVTMGQGEGHRDAPVFRGNLTTSDFFVDGMRDDLQYLRDLYNVDRVDVVKGPSALVFGRGTGGGALNRMSKLASGETITATDFTAGLYGQFRVAGDLSRSISDRVSARVNAVAEETTGFRDEMAISRRGVAPTLRFQASDTTRFDLFAERFTDERTVDRGVPSQAGRPWSGPTGTFFGNPDYSNSDIEVTTARGIFTHDFRDSLSFRSTLSWGDYSKFYDNVYAGGPVDPVAGTVRIASYNSATDRENLLAQADLAWAVSLSGLKHTILVGFEAGRQQSANRRVNTATSTFSLTDRGREFVPDFSMAPALDNTNDLNLLAVLVQDQIEFSPALKAMLGMRWDRFDLEFDDRRPGARDFARQDQFLSPRLGLVWEPVRGLSFYGGWSKAFLPQSGEQFSSLTASLSALEPEEFENLEAGLRWQPTPDLLFSASLYRLDRTHTTAPGPTPGSLVLTGSQRSEGLELALQGKVSSRWNLVGAMAFQEAEITSTTSAAPAGRAAPLVPEFSASLWNRVRLTDRFDVAVGMVHQAAQFASITNGVLLPSHTRVDAAAFYRINDRVDVQLNVENVTDEKYWFTAHNDNNITPGSPTLARLTVSARF